MTTDRTSAPTRTASRLDRAIAISLAAMTLFVLAQQLQPATVLADAQGAIATASA